MLTETEQGRLIQHINGIFHSVILPEIRPEGYILAADTDGSVYPDQVTTHHLVELCSELDPFMTSEIIDTACLWFAEKNNSPNNPFFITTLSVAKKFASKNAQEITELIIGNQRPSGFIDLYAGFLDGGNVFSTLWAIKILSLLNSGAKAKKSITKAFKAIDSHWGDMHRASFKGFYTELRWLNGAQYSHSSKTGKIVKEIIQAQDDKGFWDDSLFYTVYILGNLSAIPSSNTDPIVTESISKGLRNIFDLSKKDISFPKLLQEARNQYVDSAFIQLCIRSTISSIRYLKKFHDKEVATQIASTLFGTFPRLYNVARAIETERKKMNEQYGDIKKNFDHLQQSADEIIEESSYEKNVFVMLPFRHEQDDRYESIVQIIRTELKKQGFKAWLASDKTLRPQLWDNVASFMLACKYGIAAFTRVEKETKISVDEFNPNVSLELGFFISRGKQILLLKDTALPKLPTDLVGHLYHEFDLNMVSRQLPVIIQKWIKEITINEEKLANDKNKTA